MASGEPGLAGEAAPPPTGTRLLVLSLGALGVVYGDIGTSPLYAVRACFAGEYGVPLGHANVLGVLSLIVWSLILVVTIKYLGFVMRADNGGEGGILALMSLVAPQRGSRAPRSWLALLGLFGAALLYGDGMITPAISVLSAIEGIDVAQPALTPFILPLTLTILVALFLLQRRGTGGIGAIFGPATVVWFLTLAALGVRGVVQHPSVLMALDPSFAWSFFVHNGLHGSLVLGGVFLVVTGAEALYADMGHFGRRPIRLTWLALVLPSLLLNYLGQGALLLVNPAAISNPFYRLAPSWALYPLLVLATLATVIASQAVISGAFSLSRQAVLLGYSPRLPITHSSREQIGQVYVPPVNWALLVASCALVLGFQSSGALAAAYGMAVATTMAITTLLFYALLRRRWHWGYLAAGGLCGLFLIVDLAFLGINTIKIPSGGWLPLTVAGVIFGAMSTWKRGREVLGQRLRASQLPVQAFFADLHAIARVPGTAVFLTGNPEGTPHALLHNLKHNHVVHEQVVLLTLVTEDIPVVPRGRRLEVEDLGHGFRRVVAHSGFMEKPDAQGVIAHLDSPDFRMDPMTTTWFLGREKLIPAGRSGMARWRERLFALMSRNAGGATSFFGIPPNRVVELGAQIEL